ncbi:MAG TPA: IS66 family transposase [Pirellulales bacterium]|nr:IS66 family transposase [Pirellulales bacterium]
MDGTLLDLALSDECRDFPAQWEPIVAELVLLRRENAELRRENAELRQQAGYWKSCHAHALERLAKLEAEAEQLRGENRKLQDRLFGRKTEKTRGDRSNQLHPDGEGKTPERKPRGQRRDRPGPRRRDHSHLPVHEEFRDVPEDQRICPDCGLPYTLCGSEDSEQIEIDVRPHRRRIRRRRYRRSCHCPAAGAPQTVTAPPAPKLIPKGLLGTSLWVEILVAKFFSHQPVERLLAQWQLLGLNVAAGTVNEGLKRLEPMFAPLYEALRTRNAQSPLSQADETRWMMFIDHEGKVGHRWWLWVFLGTDTVVFVLDPSRSHEVPQGHFPAGAKMVLVVDRYSAYKAMDQVKSGNILLAFCWAHVRRDFVEVGKGWGELKPWALAWLERIRELYRCQRERLKHAPGSSEFQAADATLRQAVSAMQAEAERELAGPDLREPRRKVLTSLQEHWTGLTRFVDDVRIPMDNNASEREARGPAVGRKNYYGSGALWSGRLAAMLFSLFATLRKQGLNPRKWLTWYLESCAEAGGQAPAEVHGFLPWNLSEAKRRELSIDPHNTS